MVEEFRHVILILLTQFRHAFVVMPRLKLHLHLKMCREKIKNVREQISFWTSEMRVERTKTLFTLRCQNAFHLEVLSQQLLNGSSEVSLYAVAVSLDELHNPLSGDKEDVSLLPSIQSR